MFENPPLCPVAASGFQVLDGQAKTAISMFTNNFILESFSDTPFWLPRMPNDNPLPQAHAKAFPASRVEATALHSG
jgi:hypothetical protein